MLHARLEHVFGSEPRVRIVPFTDRMSELLAAADVLVDASVGVTCLEALASGCRIVVYGTPPGHSRDNERAIAELGLAQAAGTSEELTALLLEAARTSLPTLPAAELASSQILRTRPRVVPASHRRRRIAVAGSAAVLGALAFGGWTFASPTPYPLLARTFELRPLEGVRTSRPAVALVVRVPPATAVAVAQRLAPLRVHASFAVQQPLSRAQLASLHRLGDDALPVLQPSKQPTDLIGESRSLRRAARGLGLPARFYYLEPRKNFALADYLAARAAGGRPLSGSTRLAPGAIVVVQLGQRPPVARASVMRVITALDARGLRPVSLSELLPSASTRSTDVDRASLTTQAASTARAATSAASRPGALGHASRASSGASATGTNVFSANTMGATCVTGRRRSADISLSVPTPDAVIIARNHTPRPSHALRA